MDRVDPNEAPDGCTAAPAKKIKHFDLDFDLDYYECGECHFNGSTSEICDRAECSAAARKDGCNVIFIKKPDDGKATASWPYDSEGTPV